MKNLSIKSIQKINISKLYMDLLEEMKKKNSVTKSIVYTFAGIMIGLLAKGL